MLAPSVCSFKESVFGLKSHSPNISRRPKPVNDKHFIQSKVHSHTDTYKYLCINNANV